jgi:outer membrane protein OmpA-like peptidoglycan-associated protein
MSVFYKKNHFIVLVLATFISCAPQAQTSKGLLGGSVIGAGLGAIIGNQVGDPGAGVAIGSAFGALSGGLIGYQSQQIEEQYQENRVTLERQQELLKDNKRLIEELRSKGTNVYNSPRGVIINLPDVLFEFDSSTLKLSANEAISEIVAGIRGFANNRSIAIEGHTDSTGTMEYNMRLSTERARTVMAELIKYGISSRSITIKGFGEIQPIDSNGTPEGRSKNRRVEVIVLNR